MDQQEHTLGLALTISWRRLGEVTRIYNEIRMPTAPSLPGLYRITIERPWVTELNRTDVACIGESANIAKRLHAYTRPYFKPKGTVSQVSADIRLALDHGARVTVDTVTNVPVFFAGLLQELPLGFKADRKFAELAAIVMEQSNEAIHVLNFAEGPGGA